MKIAVKKLFLFPIVIAVLYLLTCSCACKRGVNPTNTNMASDNLAAVETNPHYMRCEDFSVLEQNKGAMDTEKIVILYSSKGTGHKSAAEAVDKVLRASEKKLLGSNKKFVIAKVDILEGLVPKLQRFDDYMNAERWIKLKELVSLQWVAEKLVNARQALWDNKILNRIMRACDERPPSMIISVFPIANYVYAEIAKENDIPLLIVPTDYEISHFINKINELKNPPANVFMGLAMEAPEVTGGLYKKDPRHPSVPYCVIGSPLRKEFNDLRKTMDRAKNPKKIKEIMNYRRSVLNIPDNAKSLLITLGGKGGSLEIIEQYLKAFHAMQKQKPLEQALHVIVASGGSKLVIDGLKAHAAQFANNKLFNLKVLDRLDAHNMALCMASVDAVLAKPGGSTVAEAGMLKTPMLIKSDSTLALPWEKTNMLLAKRLGWGVDLAFAPKRVVDTQDVVSKLKQIFSWPKYLNQETSFIDFQTKFTEFIQLIRERETKKFSNFATLECRQ